MTAIAQYVAIRPQFSRAVNISRDGARPGIAGEILFTPLMANAFERLLANLEHKAGERNFMIFGPYGAGKSAFALFLNALFGMRAKKSNPAYRQMAQRRPDLAARFASAHRAPWLCLPLTARQGPIGAIIMDGLMAALARLPDSPQKEAFAGRLAAVNAGSGWRDGAVILEMMRHFHALALAAKFGGVLLAIDEVGKCLEYAMRDGIGGDLYIFQMLAEYAADAPGMLFLTIQHQLFEGYAPLADIALRREWAKVQERFEPLPFSDGHGQTLRMLPHVFCRRERLPNEISAQILAEAMRLEEAGARLPVGLELADFYELCQQTWPLHPATLLVMPLLFSRLAQNERSLFSYLGSLEPRGFQEHLRGDSGNDFGFARLYHLADYFLTNLTASLAQRPFARALFEILDREQYGLDATAERLLLVIGLLNALGSAAPIKPAAAALEAIMPQGADVEGALAALRQKRLLTFRQSDGAYRLWEGGSIDLQELLREARQKIRWQGRDFVELLRRQSPGRPFVARRHCLQTGAYRFFDLEYAAGADDIAAAKSMRASCEAGRIVALLPLRNAEALAREAEAATRADPSLLIALPAQMDALIQPALELACLGEIEISAPELQGDRAALREFDLLRAESLAAVRRQMALLLNPEPPPAGCACRWYWRGERQNVCDMADITRLLSAAADFLYPHAPRISNELIARPVLSSAATAARTILMKRMLHNEAEASLGISGYPPERSMYESVLRETGLHRQAGGAYRFCPPAAASPLAHLWQALDTAIFEQPGRQISLAQLGANLALPPVGLPEGLLPPLFLAYYLTNRRELFLYREGAYIPQLEDAALELMQRRPDIFSVSGVRLSGERKILVERYAAGLHVEAAAPAVAASLYAALRQLPELTVYAEDLRPQRGKAFIRALRAASAPEKLLFQDLPLAFGIMPLLADGAGGEADALTAALRESMIELVNHAAKTRSACRDYFLRACGLSMGGAGFELWLARAGFLAQKNYNPALAPLLDRALRADEDTNKTLEGILSLLGGRPFMRWRAADRAAFERKAASMGEEFRRAFEIYGMSFLDAEEQAAAAALCHKLSSQIQDIGCSRQVIMESLRNLLRRLEAEE